MNEKFSRFRVGIKDRDVKGGVNEDIVGRFIAEFVPDITLRYNVELLGSEDIASDEIDIAACNRFQMMSDSRLLLAEGVDFVIQVKAILTSEELARIATNCRRAKAVRRSFDPRHDRFKPISRDSSMYHLSRIPYFVFAFDSHLKLDTARERWLSIILDQGLSEIEQPDGIFLLKAGALLRFDPSGERVVESDGASAWFSSDMGEDVLLNFVATILTLGRAVTHIQNPLLPYLANRVLPGKSYEKSYGHVHDGDVVDAVLTQLYKILNVLLRATPTSPVVAELAAQKLDQIKECIDGTFPLVALLVVDDNGEHVPIEDKLKSEIDVLIKYGVGTHPHMTPSPVFGAPILFESRAIGKNVKLYILSSFFAEIQAWVEQYCMFFIKNKQTPVAAK